MRTPLRAVLAAALAAGTGCSLTLDPGSVAPPARAPTIALSASSLTFTAQEGGASPAAQTFGVSNSGAGALATPVATVAYQGGGAWCTATVSGAAAPYTVTVQANVTGLTAGIRAATISVSVPGASNSPQLVAVTFQVGSPTLPTIALSQSSLTFSATTGSAAPSQTLTVSNSGAGTLATPTTTIGYGGAAGWLTAAVTGSSAPFTVTVTASAAALPASGTPYTATVQVTSAGASNTPQSFTVSFTVLAPPLIQLSRAQVDFTAVRGTSSPAAQTVTVTNGGGGTLAALSTSVSYAGATGWLAASASGGTITLTPALGTLVEGTYLATVSVSSAGASNSPQPIGVRFTVTSAQPVVSLSTPSLSFSATEGTVSPSPQAVTVTNGGSGTLATPSTLISYQDGSGWLAATVTGTSEPYTITVTPTLGTLSAGTYRATVDVGAVGATPAALSVIFTVGSASQPTIALSKYSVTFQAVAGSGTSPAADAVAIANSGTGALALPTATVQYGQGTGWLAAAVTGASAPYTLTLTPTLGSLADGTYTATVSVASAGASNTPQPVRVTFTVLKAASIVLSSSTIGFSATQNGTSPPAQTVTVTNGGAAPLAVPTLTPTYEEAQTGWLNAAVSGAAAPYTITLTPTLGTLAAGTYHASVQVASTGASNTPQTIAVTFTVGVQPTMVLSSNSLTFSAVQGGANPTPQSVTVSNSVPSSTLTQPTASIAYAGGASGWLSVGVSSGGAPYTVTVTPATGALAAGSYSATVSVASTGATNTPQSIGVSFTVTSASVPTLAADRTSLTFTATAGGTSPAPQPVALTNSASANGSTLAPPTVAVAYTSGSGWVSTSLAGADNAYTLTVSASVVGLAAGTYQATVTVTSAGANGSPLSIPVTFTVGAQPAITLSTSSLTFSATANGANPAAQIVNVTNSVPSSTLAAVATSIQYLQGNGWLVLTPGGAGNAQSISVQPSISGVIAGTYMAMVTVSSPGASNTPQAFSVTLTVAAQPTLSLSTTSLSFSGVQGGANPASQPITVSNVGGGTLAAPTATPTYSDATNGGNCTAATCTWLAGAGIAISGSAAPYTVTVQPQLTGLTAGTYAATLRIDSTGASNTPQFAFVTLSVGSPSIPTIALSRTSVSFAANVGAQAPAAQNVTVTNSGTGTLQTPTTTTVYAQGAGWLAVTVGGGPSSFTVSIQPMTTSLPEGTYTATVNVASAGASNSPQPITVSYTVTGVSACIVAAGGHSVCGSSASAGGAASVAAASGHAVRRSAVQSGAAATVQSATRLIVRGTVSPGAAKP